MGHPGAAVRRLPLAIYGGRTCFRAKIVRFYAEKSNATLAQNVKGFPKVALRSYATSEGWDWKILAGKF